jgi:hypothetical protein
VRSRRTILRWCCRSRRWPSVCHKRPSKLSGTFSGLDSLLWWRHQIECSWIIKKMSTTKQK